mgnify:CR=1 FL=1
MFVYREWLMGILILLWQFMAYWAYEFLVVLVGFLVFDYRLGILVFLFYLLGFWSSYPINGIFLYYVDILHIMDWASLVKSVNICILDFYDYVVNTIDYGIWVKISIFDVLYRSG